jgi:hypothetical protein
MAGAVVGVSNDFRIDAKRPTDPKAGICGRLRVAGRGRWRSAVPARNPPELRDEALLRYGVVAVLDVRTDHELHDVVLLAFVVIDGADAATLVHDDVGLDGSVDLDPDGGELAACGIDLEVRIRRRVLRMPGCDGEACLGDAEQQIAGLRVGADLANQGLGHAQTSGLDVVCSSACSFRESTYYTILIT